MTSRRSRTPSAPEWRGLARARLGGLRGCERFFRPGYAMNLTSHVDSRPGGRAGAARGRGGVADVGCGRGASTIIMAQAFPRSSFLGIRLPRRVHRVGARAPPKAGVADRVTFEVATGEQVSRHRLRPRHVLRLSPRHGRSGRRGAARASVARPGASWMLVEPMANDRLEDNLNPIGRLYYGASTLLCTPASLSQDVGLALGAQAGEARLAQGPDRRGRSARSGVWPRPREHGPRGARLSRPE